ncbi:MAG: SEL1-like repeat protein [Paludibacteraceae bacterium]|nr:SEL1-like repeat protein [Paludibacteraceae bacterium]
MKKNIIVRMPYPLISEYIEAIKVAEDNFKELTNLRPVLSDDGQPVMTSGNFAVVFKMEDIVTGKFYALKCFTKEQEGRAEAYHQIADALMDVDSPYLVSLRYLDKELFVDTDQTAETEFPVLLMDWVEGKTLDKYLRENLDDKYALEMLAYRFSQLAQWLIPQSFAHGDLKPDNILVREDGTLVLVDYDGMYVPAMKGQTAPELGSPDFRHPLRTENDFDEHIDDFSLISILLSLKAISLNPLLLYNYGTSDRLLFSLNDYNNISNSIVVMEIQLFLDAEDCRNLLSVFLLCLTSKIIPVAFLKYLYLYFEGMNCEQYDLLSNELKETISKAVIGDMVEQKKLGYMFYYGEGLYKNYSKAIYWYNASATHGYPVALYNMGICYQQGTGVRQNYAEALKWFYKAAEKGYASAQYMVGLYNKDEKYGLDINLKESFRWLTKALVQGEENAQRAIEDIYCIAALNGFMFNVEVNIEYSEIYSVFKLLAEQDNKYGLYNIGLCYWQGIGVDQDKNEALKWYELAAKQGHRKAQEEIKEWDSYWFDGGKALYSKNKLTFHGVISGNEYEIKEGTKFIADKACSDMGWEIDCSYFNKITIPKSVICIGDNPFGCQMSEVICLSPYFEVENDTLYSKEKRELIQCFNHKVHEFIVPEGVKVIRSFAFYSCSINKIVIPASISEIHKNPFIETGVFENHQYKLEVISNSPLFVIIKNTLYQGNRLISYWGTNDYLEIPSGIEEIGECAFWGAGVRTIKLPASLKTVGEDSFYWTEFLEELIVPIGEIERFRNMLPLCMHSLIVENDYNEMTF